MEDFAPKAQEAYDKIVDTYDDNWAKHVLAQHARMTEDLKLQKGERLVDIACGSGLTMVPMMRRVAPGETVGVDNSGGMLELAKGRAAAEGLPLTVQCMPAQQFFANVEEASFDVLSLRFGLAYLDWETDLPKLGRIVKPGHGRVGVLTSLSSSAPQALKTYHLFADEMGLEKAYPPVPSSTDQVAAKLAEGGLTPVLQWTERVRVWFANGVEASNWFRISGYITSRTFNQYSEEMLDMFVPIFAARLEEGFLEAQGVPLDFDIGCVIAERR